MLIDHVFIFAEQGPAAANALVNFGFTEGSSRVHPGQGTANRKFYFQGGVFLEVLYVHNMQELQSPRLQPSGLAQRAAYAGNGSSRFGLCLENLRGLNNLFAQAVPYQPTYLPEGQAIQVLPFVQQPTLPWTFRLPFIGPKKPSTEPMQHANGLNQVTKVSFGVASEHLDHPAVKALGTYPDISFEPATKPALTLTFNHGQQGQSHALPGLDLTLIY